MVFCKTCDAEVEAFQEERSGYTVCTSCGQVLDQSAWSSEPTFTKEGGESTVAGHFVSEVAGSHGLGRISNGRIYGFQYDATEKAGSKGRGEIERLVDLLGIRPRDDVVNSAHRLYMLAVQHNFNRGRRTAQIAAAAIYIICRQEGHPFMLLDFSDVLQVNVFALGSVFMQLCKILRLEEHAIITRPTDPSLYLHRFADRMGFGSKMHQVAKTALMLISQMKRDWLQTGRRPAGVCGAALYVAGHIHGFQISRADVVRIVHIGESTLEKRVTEFAGTDACALTAVEFEEHSKEIERDEQLRIETIGTAAALAGPLPTPEHGCGHVGEGGSAAVFAHGMCKECYLDFIKVSGGLDTAGANPPAFTAGLIKANGSKNPEALEGASPQKLLPQYAGQGEESVVGGNEIGDSHIEEEMADALQDSNLLTLAKAIVPQGDLPSAPAKKAQPAQKRKKKNQQPADKAGARKSKRQKAAPEPANSQVQSTTANPSSEKTAAQEEKFETVETCQAVVPILTEQDSKGPPADFLEGIPEELSDLSEDERDYFHSATEVKLKGIVWTAMNQDYIEKQTRKKALEAKKQEEQEAQLLLEDGKAKPKKGRPKGPRKPKPEENLEPSETAADGIRKMLDAKKLSSKVNYEALDNLFEDPKAIKETDRPQSPKRGRASAPAKLPGSPVQKDQAAKKKKSEKVKVTFAEPDSEPAESAGQGPPEKSALRSSALGSVKSLGGPRRKTNLPTSKGLF